MCVSVCGDTVFFGASSIECGGGRGLTFHSSYPDVEAEGGGYSEILRKRILESSGGARRLVSLDFTLYRAGDHFLVHDGGADR